MEVDSEYTKMLINIQENNKGTVKMKVDDMEDCLLKSIYKKEKIKYAEIFFLCASPTGIIYTSLATSKDISNFNNYSLYINLAIGKLKNIFSEEQSRVFKDVIIREENETRLKEIYIEKLKLKESLEEYGEIN